ncbi:LysR substrate-binding domain-containing protein [Pollutimonas sp. M17]|uniref:LysR substrate-binding domain-containing protein n=1 Tax=Pollutimonas sp. M17 TaxID=2962065 RepID=UPI0021F40D9B|nr:LysR substrate-binding domain-containing protein [Pollutimonas sp. M17]UYO92918.1 LysR substrate-binding domain-containing protein [Pollutimonas sp. M17]HWK70934.1 LysR substrate-binding domain-containing protein [Burkholderiaceae bacterium]
MRNGIPNLGALQAFEATARLGSFSRAAEELSLTHSAVYRQVTGLEERLGVQLLTRVRRRVAVTEAGAEYAARVRHHLEQLEKDTFGLVSRSGMGRSLHIAVLPTLATTWLVPRLPDFQRLHGDIAVSLSVRTLPFQFNDHPFDAAIYHAAQIWPQTAGIKLFDEEELLPVCIPELVADAADPLRALDGLTHLHMLSRPDAWRQWYQAQGKEYLPSMSAGPRYELFTMTLAAVRAGLGVALVPRFLAQDELARGSLVAPSPGVLAVSDAYFFSYPVSSERSEALIAFESWLAGITQP